MLAGKKSIFFSTELEYPPFEPFKISNDGILKLFNALRDSDGYPYANLEIQANPPRLSTRHDHGESRCEIGPHTIIISEKNPQMQVDDFAKIVTTILERLGNDRPPFLLQRCTIQMTAQPQNVDDSVDLLADHLANVMHQIDPFKRPPSSFGVRFRFPPFEVLQGIANGKDGEEEKSEEIEEAPEGGMIVHSEDAQGFAEVRFESYAKDIRSVWMEIKNAFPLKESSLDKIRENILCTHTFLSEKCVNFLDQFDSKKTNS